MQKMTANQIRQTWLNYFHDHDHMIIPSASLIPINDNSILWVNSGVATLKKFFSGQENPPHLNLVNSQKCIRTNDIYNVGITSRHHTFFEMLGNFSIGGYFKEAAIDLAYDLLINHFHIDPKKLYITVYEEDQITYDKWCQFADIEKSHIIMANKSRNFWDIGSGPCGPCTEIYYDRGPKFDFENIGEKLFFEDMENDRYVEIWNIVFSEYNNDGHGNYTPLKRKNIDTGAGLERLACISQDVPTNFDTDLFIGIIEVIQKHAEFKYEKNAYFFKDEKQIKINLAYKIIADHARSSVFAIADGAIPSNKERGYILRRLIRRMIVKLQRLSINTNILSDVVSSTIETMQVAYPYLISLKDKINDVINTEYQIFKKTLNQGMLLYLEAVKSHTLSGNVIFKLVETFGFPIELIKELATDDNIELDIITFENLFKQHQKISHVVNNEQAMQAQNGALLELNTDFKFLYDVNDITAKIVQLYDSNFNQINELNGDGYVVFDQSCLFATSGGQMHDIGFIDNNIEIIDVIKGPNLQHIHHVSAAKNLAINTVHSLSYNNDRRMKLMRNHSVEHLIHAALAKIIDPNIKQEGAYKSPEKVTFDFQYHVKLTEAQIESIENQINQVIHDAIPVSVLELNLDEAQALGAKAYFEDVYKKIKGKLRVVKMGDASCELCGGTHVHNTKNIEIFKIVNLTSKAAGSWRIEAITSNDTVIQYLQSKREKLADDVQKIKASGIANDELLKYMTQIDFENNDIKYLDTTQNELAVKFNFLKMEHDKLFNKQQTEDIKEHIKTLLSSKSVVTSFKNLDNRNLFNALSELINEYQTNIFAVFNIVENKIQYMLATNEINKNINLNVDIKLLNNLTGGKGGGKPNFVQGGCVDYNDMQQLFTLIKEAFDKYA